MRKAAVVSEAEVTLPGGWVDRLPASQGLGHAAAATMINVAVVCCKTLTSTDIIRKNLWDFFIIY